MTFHLNLCSSAVFRMSQFPKITLLHSKQVPFRFRKNNNFFGLRTELDKDFVTLRRLWESQFLFFKNCNFYQDVCQKICKYSFQTYCIVPVFHFIKNRYQIANRRALKEIEAHCEKNIIHSLVFFSLASIGLSTRYF